MFSPMLVARVVSLYNPGPIDYTRRDCARFAAGVVNELTGINYLEGFCYENEQEAEAAYKKFGGLSAAVTHAMRRDPLPAFELTPGAVVLWSVGGVDGLGIALDRTAKRSAVLADPGMIRELPRRFIKHGWNI